MLLFKGIPKVNQEDGLTFDQIRSDLKKLASSKCFKHNFPDASEDYSALKSAALDSRYGHYHKLQLLIQFFTKHQQSTEGSVEAQAEGDDWGYYPSLLFVYC